MDASRRDDQDILPVLEEAETSEQKRRRIDPGSPSFENVAFVLLGVLLTIVIFLNGLGLL